METIISLDAFAAILAGLPFLQFLLDLLLKSSLVIAATYLIAMTFRRHISNNGAHLLWFNSMLCVALLPLAVIFLSPFPAVFLDGGPITVISIDSTSASLAESAAVDGQLLIGFFYSIVASGLLLRLLYSALALRRINCDALYCTNASILRQVRRLCESLEISRTVTVKVSEDVASPMSFGVFKPVVVLPSVAAGWPASTLEDVLVHELSHIKRLDWVTMLFCHLLTSLFWINPLVWFARTRVNEAAEQACDAAVLRYGNDGISYAEELLRLARESLSEKQAPVLAQMMFDESSLSLRIKNILDGGLIEKVSKKFVSTLIVVVVLVLGACSGINLFGTNKYDGEILPTKADPPQYPTRAAQEGIEGWVLVDFTINEDGLIAENSVKVIDAEPQEIFDRAATRAAARFEFEPPRRNGKPVDIEGVQYVFRFNLEPGGYQPEGQRPPPPARSRSD